MSKCASKDADACEIVLQYLHQQNRPYSVIDIFNNLHKEVGKTAIQKALDSLVKEGSVKEKPYGKQKIYVADQSNLGTTLDSELKAMDQEINRLTQDAAGVQLALKQTNAEHQSLTATMTTEQASKSLCQLTDECAALQQKLAKLSEGKVTVSKEEKEKVHKSKEVAVKEWKKRKRMAMDVLNAILEGCPKPKKALFEEIGIETDEEYKAVLPDP